MSNLFRLEIYVYKFGTLDGTTLPLIFLS